MPSIPATSTLRKAPEFAGVGVAGFGKLYRGEPGGADLVRVALYRGYFGDMDEFSDV